MEARLPLLAHSLARPLAAAAAGQRPGVRPRLLRQLRHGHSAHSNAARQQLASAAAAQTARAQAGAAPQQLPPVALSAATADAHKQLNRRLVEAAEASPAELLALVEAELPAFNAVNATTAFHRLAKVISRAGPGGWGRGQAPAASGGCGDASGCGVVVAIERELAQAAGGCFEHCLRPRHAINPAHHAQCAAALPPAQRDALRGHPSVLRLAASLAGSVGQLGDVQVSQLLWAHAQLGHATPALLDALYARLATARVLAAGAAGSDGGGSGAAAASGGRDGGSGKPPAAPPLVVADTRAACTLAWAQAKLRRPQPELLQRLAAALLAATAAAGERRGSAARPAAGAATSSSGSSGPGGVSLAACDGRALCLLAWSLSALGACPPALLAAITSRARAAPGGLAGLGRHSLCNLLTAHAAVVEAQAGALPWDQRLVDDAAAALAASGAPQGRARAQHAGRQQDAQQRQQQQQQQRRPRQQQQQAPQLNEADCSILVRCLAAAWQEAAVASGADTGEPVRGGHLCPAGWLRSMVGERDAPSSTAARCSWLVGACRCARAVALPHAAAPPPARRQPTQAIGGGEAARGGAARPRRRGARAGHLGAAPGARAQRAGAVGCASRLSSVVAAGAWRRASAGCRGR